MNSVEQTWRIRVLYFHERISKQVLLDSTQHKHGLFSSRLKPVWRLSFLCISQFQFGSGCRGRSSLFSPFWPLLSVWLLVFYFFALWHWSGWQCGGVLILIICGGSVPTTEETEEGANGKWETSQKAADQWSLSEHRLDEQRTEGQLSTDRKLAMIWWCHLRSAWL